MPASLIAAGDALARFFAAPGIGSVPHRSARQGILILVAFIGGMLPISNMAMLSSAYLAREVISGISSSIGVILSVPITAFISSILMENAKVEPREGVQLPQKKE